MISARLIANPVSILLVALSFTEACDKGPGKDEARLEVTPTSLTVDAAGGQVSFSVLSSEDWMASVGESWA